MSLTAAIAAFLCRLDERTIPPEVMEKALDEDGKLAMTVRVDPTKSESVRARFK